MGDGPFGFVMSDSGSVYFTLSGENTLELPVGIGGRATWAVSPPVRVDGAGVGTVALAVEYRGSAPVTSDEVRFVVALTPGGLALAEQRVVFARTWTPW